MTLTSAGGRTPRGVPSTTGHAQRAPKFPEEFKIHGEDVALISITDSQFHLIAFLELFFTKLKRSLTGPVRTSALLKSNSTGFKIPKVVKGPGPKAPNKESKTTQRPVPKRVILKPGEVTPGWIWNCAFCVLKHKSDCCGTMFTPATRDLFAKAHNMCRKCFGLKGPNHACKNTNRKCRYCKNTRHADAFCLLPEMVINDTEIQKAPQAAAARPCGYVDEFLSPNQLNQGPVQENVDTHSACNAQTVFDIHHETNYTIRKVLDAPNADGSFVITGQK
uniref:Nuclear receptor domain-containing protein n=1 Tax=Caenorhabditis tropicalis TaxID=1561998 RepID=A0A1I7TT70_9PELO